MKINILENGEANVQIDPWDLYSVDTTLAKVIAPILKSFRDNTHGCPGSFLDDEKKQYLGKDDFETWKNILNKMIDGFERINDDKYWNLNKENWLAVQESLRLFAKFYMTLWD